MVYNSCHKKSLMHLAEKTQPTVYTSKFHPHSSMVERDRCIQPGRKAVRTGTTQSVHQSWRGCECTQVVNDTTNRAIAVCLWFNIFTAIVATGDWSWHCALHIAASTAATASTDGSSVKLRYTQYSAQDFFQWMSEKEVLIREMYKYGSTFLFWSQAIHNASVMMITTHRIRAAWKQVL